MAASTDPPLPSASVVPAAATAADLLPEEVAPLRVIRYPDPRLRRRSLPVEAFPPDVTRRLRVLADRMFQLMREHRGVGLAAPQVGINVRLFVMNTTGEPGDNKVYVNPVLSDPVGEAEREEGCLSLPEIETPVLRSERMRLRAVDPEGHPIDETADDLAARCWQHEIDHLDGVLILDKMPPTVKIASRKKLKELEEEYREAHPSAAPQAPPRKKGFWRKKR